jgi:hypothetical protein
MADPERYRRQQIRRRRRDIVGLLAGTTVLTALLGLVPSLHILWVVTVVGVLGLAAYIGLAVQALRMARLPGAAAGTRGGTARDAHQYAGRGYPGAWDDVDIAASDPDGYGYGDYEPDRRAVAR